MLMNIQTLQWDPHLCKVFDIPMSILPQIKSSSEIYGCLTESVLKGVPISGVSLLILLGIKFNGLYYTVSV